METFLTAISVVSTICAIAFGYAAFSRNRKTDTTDEAKNDATVLSEIGYMKAGVDDIKRKLEKQDERHLEIMTRLTAVEVSAKQAHKRLDQMEGREDRG